MKNQKIERVRRQQIINSALYFFNEKGYSKTAVDDICKSLKISHGLFYHYYTNKYDLLKDMLKIGYQTVLSKFPLEPVDEKKALIEFTEGLFNFIKEDLNHAYLLSLLLKGFADNKLRACLKDSLKEADNTRVFKTNICFQKLHDQGRLKYSVDESIFMYNNFVIAMTYRKIYKISEVSDFPEQAKCLIDMLVK